MISFIRSILCVLALLCMTSLGAEEVISRPTVLVSVAPHKFFVEKIAGDTVNVHLMVPAGSSSHTFEPTPRQMLSATKGDLWFQIGEGFEPRAARALLSHNPNMKLIDLRQGLHLIDSSCEETHCCCHNHDSCIDPHFWLSPKEAKIQAQSIAKALIDRYPQHARLYQERLASFIRELDQLDSEIATGLTPLKNRIIMVSHPAYAYFARDYHIKQLSIEFEGKDPTPQQLTKILNQARQANIRKIYIQLQYNNKGARLIAQELGAEVVVLDPYSEDYINSMRKIAYSFANQ